MLLDMELSQKISKLVPYTALSDNKVNYAQDAFASDSEEATTLKKDESRDASTHNQPYQSLFFNFNYRDKFNWNRMHVIKMIYHRPSHIIFIFSSDVKGADKLAKMMKKTYKFAPAQPKATVKPVEET